MWLKILISIIPVERIVAACLDYLLRKNETPKRAKQAKKILEAAVAFKDCIDDSDGAGKPSREAIAAWAKGEKTPDVWKGKSE